MCHGSSTLTKEIEWLIKLIDIFQLIEILNKTILN